MIVLNMLLFLLVYMVYVCIYVVYTMLFVLYVFYCVLNMCSYLIVVFLFMRMLCVYLYTFELLFFICYCLTFIFHFHDHDVWANMAQKRANRIVRKMAREIDQKWPKEQRMVRKIDQRWSNKWSGKCSPDFEGEFIDMFPIDRLSIFDGIWTIPRHLFFRRLRNNVRPAIFAQLFALITFLKSFFS